MLDVCTEHTEAQERLADWLLLGMSAGAGEAVDGRTVQEWIEARGGIERSVRDRVRGVFLTFKQRYWPLFAEFLKSASAEVVTEVILSLGRCPAGERFDIPP